MEVGFGKPAEITPLSSLKIAELMAQAGMPDGVVNILPGLGAVAGQAIAEHDRISKIAFTGSTATARRIARALLDDVGLTEYADTVAVEMPYGRKRALEIATTLALEPDMMLLDEPTQGMGHEDIERVVDLIRKVSANRTILMVEHNLSVVANLCDRITVLTRGSVLAEGTYEEVSKNPQVLEAYVGSDNMNDAHH